MPITHNITFGGETLVLNADRTLWWPRQKVLFVTDLHAGKTEHMRRHGLAIPAGSLPADLAVIQTALQRYDAKQLLFLGDLFHSEPNDEWDIFSAWCRAQPCEIGLVRGNHDRFLTDAQVTAAGMSVFTEPYNLPPFILRHHPLEKLADQFVLAGHVHPVFWTAGPGHDRLRNPCFWLQPQQLILPAFGSFTGGYAINRHVSRADKVYACSLDRSLVVPYKI